MKQTMHSTPSACATCSTPAVRALADAIAQDDIARAIDEGLLEFEAPPHPCAACAERVASIVAARDVRVHALAARERFRRREVRLRERERARAEKRRSASPTTAPETADIAAAASKPTASTLPPAAAAALARAKAKAAAKREDDR